MRIILLLICTAIALSARAGNENYHLGARSAGLGNASVSLSGLWSVHHNQAGMAFLTDPEAGIYYESRFLMKALSIRGAAFAYPTSSGTFGMAVTGFGDSRYGESKLSLTYGRLLGEKISAGIGLNYHSTRISAENYGNTAAFTVEAGFQAKITKELILGAHLFNPTRAKLTDFNDERIPTVMRLGVSYEFSEKVFVAIETEKDISFPAVAKLGIEYHVMDILYLRAGISTEPVMNTFGFGLELNDFKLDFSSSIHSTLGVTPQISMSYTL